MSPVAAAVELWWKAEPWHDAVDRALGIDRHQEGGLFALYPFRLAKVEGQWRILAAYPCPRNVGVFDETLDDVTAVIAWEPKTNRLELLGEAQAQLVGRFDAWYCDSKSGTIYGTALPFFHAWARARAQWLTFAKIHAAKQDMPEEPDLVPGCLVIGDVRYVRWPLAAMPETIECIGIDAKGVNSSILRSAKLPRAVDATVKAAA